MSPDQIKIGVISDTHGVLDSRVHQLFQGVERIIHAGDIGNPDVIIELRTIAPVYAVWGNMDKWNIRDHYAREFLDLTILDFQLAVIHKPESMYKIQKAPDLKTIRIHGHTHEPRVQQDGKDNIILNPGSITQPRGGYKPSVALLTLQQGQQPLAKIMYL